MASAMSAQTSLRGCTIHERVYGTVGNETVRLFTLQNQHQMQVDIINFGGIITALRVPDQHGVVDDVVAGFDDLAGYIKDDACFGAIVGPYANRIGKKGFWLDGRFYPLHTNDGENTLHSSLAGLQKKLWQAETESNEHECKLVLSILCKDGEGGFPGNRHITATYTLNQHNELSLVFEAITDKATPISLTGHSYFNLAGGGTALDHQLTLQANHILPVDATLIPEGAPMAVADTPFDFRQPQAVGARIDVAHPQLKQGNGYDHTFVVPEVYRNGSMPVARVCEPTSGRIMELFTTSPGVQFYSANYLSASAPGKQGRQYCDRDALALEPQQFPDAPNQPGFPNPVLRPAEQYQNRIVYKFSTR